MKCKLEIVACGVQACLPTGFKKAHQLEKGPKAQVGELTESQMCHSVGLVGSGVTKMSSHVTCASHMWNVCITHRVAMSLPRQVSGLTVLDWFGPG